MGQLTLPVAIASAAHSHHITEQSSTVSPFSTNVYNEVPEGLWAGICIPLPDLQVPVSQEIKACPKEVVGTYIFSRGVIRAIVGGTGDKVKRDSCSLPSIPSAFSLNMTGKHFPSGKHFFCTFSSSACNTCLKLHH